jgi:signal peptidase II
LNRKYFIAAALGFSALALDQTAKVFARALLAPLSSYDLLPGYLELRYAENTGIAFSLFNHFPPAYKLPLFTTITLVAVTIIVHLLRQAPARSVRLPAALGLVLAGALGNLADRFHWPGVVDFIRVQAWQVAGYSWPIFNVADMAITAGIVLLLIDTLFAREEEEKTAPLVRGPETMT